jgi:hypothetical protein
MPTKPLQYSLTGHQDLLILSSEAMKHPPVLGKYNTTPHQCPRQADSNAKLLKLTQQFLSTTTPSKPSLTALPNELLILISKSMNQTTLSAFTQVNKTLHALLDKNLYKYNARYNWGDALDWAMQHGNLGVARKAIDATTNGIYRSRREHLGVFLVDAVHAACEAWPHPSSNNYIAIAELLLASGAKTRNLHEKTKYVPIYEVAQAGITQLARSLIRYGSPIEPPFGACSSATRYTTPLVPATINGHVEIVELLLVYGADVNGRVYQRRAPLDYASEAGYRFPEIKRLLESYEYQTKKLHVVSSSRGWVGQSCF